MLDRVSVIDPTTDFRAALRGQRYAVVMADPSWRFQNSTGKVAPERKRLSRYDTVTLAEIMGLPVAEASAEVAHLYLWVPDALLPEGLAVMQAWGAAPRVTSSGTRSGRTAARTGAASASPFAP